jgi:hypothetical protein
LRYDIFLLDSFSHANDVMVRKLLNRKELRDAADAAEQVDAQQSKVKPKKTATKKKPTHGKNRSKDATEVRLKAFWGVFNQALKRVAIFEYSDRKSADKKAEELSASGKSPHFVQPVKEVIQD